MGGTIVCENAEQTKQTKQEDAENRRERELAARRVGGSCGTTTSAARTCGGVSRAGVNAQLSSQARANRSD
jgi:hypothetical protein